MAWSQCMTTIPRGLLNVKLIEPPCTERYARWCERSANQLMISLLLDLQCLVSEKSFLLGKSSVYGKERDLDGSSGSQRGSSTFVGKGAASDKRTGTGTVAIPCAGSGRKLGDAGLGNASCRQSVKGINFFVSEGLTKIG